MSAQCATCATPVPEDSRFCWNCGTAVSDPADPATDTLDATTAQAMEAWLREATRGEFEVHEELGRGGMAVVFLATEVHLKRKVAIKVLPPELTLSENSRERFKREAQTAAALSHPNIIPIYRISGGGKLFWYAMQYIEGQPLDRRLAERGALPLPEVAAILGQVADALDYAHELHVVHRDIKPANIILDGRGRAIITDFGIAKQIAASGLTASGAVIGTPYYMSPEQCRGSALSGAADQYSVGVMAFQLLSGQLPFRGESAIQILTSHCTEAPPRLDEVRPDAPAAAVAAISRALEKDPARRFRSVGNFVLALRGEAVDDRAPHSGGRRALVAGVLVLVTAVVGVILLIGDRLPLPERTPGRTAPALSPAEPGRISVGTRPPSVVFINGERAPGHPVLNFVVPAGRVELRFEVTDQRGAWSRDTVFQVAAGEHRRLGFIELERAR